VGKHAHISADFPKLFSALVFRPPMNRNRKDRKVLRTMRRKLAATIRFVAPGLALYLCLALPIFSAWNLAQGSMTLLGVGGPYVFVNSEAATVAAAFTTPPNKSRKIKIDTYVGALKACGTWSKKDYLWVHAAHTEQAGLINWKNPGTATAVNTNSMTFTANSGFTSDGTTSYLALGVTFNSLTLTQNSGHLGSKLAGTLADTLGAQVVGRADGNGRYSLTVIRSGAAYNITARLATASPVTSADAGDIANYLIAVRRGASEVELYSNGTSLSSTTEASESVGSGNAQVGQSNTNFSPNTVIHQLTHFGVALSDTEVSCNSTAVSNYFSGL
jgi:hypothetical protein